MKTALSTYLQISAVALVTAVVCASLLALPASVVDLEIPLFMVGFCLGAVLGAGTVTGRVSFPIVGATFGGLTALTLGFGYEYGRYGSNLRTLEHGGLWLSGLVLVLASIGAVYGLAHRSVEPRFARFVMWPICALLPIAAAFLWGEFSERQRVWGNELVIASLAAIILHVALLRFCRRKAHEFDESLFWITWWCWPWLVALTFSLLWMLNHRAGLHADTRSTPLFAFGLLLLVLISNATVVALNRRTKETTSVYKALGLFLAVTIAHIFSSLFLALGMIHSHT